MSGIGGGDVSAGQVGVVAGAVVVVVVTVVIVVVVVVMVVVVVVMDVVVVVVVVGAGEGIDAVLPPPHTQQDSSAEMPSVAKASKLPQSSSHPEPNPPLGVQKSCCA